MILDWDRVFAGAPRQQQLLLSGTSSKLVSIDWDLAPNLSPAVAKSLTGYTGWDPSSTQAGNSCCYQGPAASDKSILLIGTLPLTEPRCCEIPKDTGLGPKYKACTQAGNSCCYGTSSKLDKSILIGT
jgi:hypothetical protein